MLVYQAHTHTLECISKSRNTLPKFLENGSKIGHSHPANTHHLFARTWLKLAQANPQPTSRGQKCIKAAGACVCGAAGLGGFGWTIRTMRFCLPFLVRCFGSLLLLLLFRFVETAGQRTPRFHVCACVCLFASSAASWAASSSWRHCRMTNFFQLFLHTHTPHTPFTLSAFIPLSGGMRFVVEFFLH